MVPISNVLNETEKLNKPKIEKKTTTSTKKMYFILFFIWFEQEERQTHTHTKQ